jgi:hypothetical protein
LRQRTVRDTEAVTIHGDHARIRRSTGISVKRWEGLPMLDDAASELVAFATCGRPLDVFHPDEGEVGDVGLPICAD